MRTYLNLFTCLLTMLVSNLAFAQSDQGLTETRLIRVASQATTATGQATKTGLFRVNKAIEGAVKRAKRNLKAQCLKTHSSDASCNKVCVAKKFDKGRATIKNLKVRRICEFGGSKTKIVRNCRAKKKKHREVVEAKGQCACSCSKYHRNAHQKK